MKRHLDKGKKPAGHGPRAVICESLETRYHLSTVWYPPAVATAMPAAARALSQSVKAVRSTWPAAPFQGVESRMIYTNQFGDAVITGQFSEVSRFRGYTVEYDDTGPVQMHAGGEGVEAAIYLQDGTPDRILSEAAVKQGVAVTANANPWKLPMYVAVKQMANSGGSYRLRLNGPSVFVKPIAVSTKTHVGMGGSGISSPGDSDFFSFTTTRAGNWTVAVSCEKKLDAMIVVYNSAGKPVGGTYTEAINRGGPQAVETWSGVGLAAGATYYVRVEGRGNSTGNFHVMTWRTDRLATVQVRSRVNAAEGNASPGRFEVRRSGSLSAPLVFRYMLSGTATNGSDYTRLTGTGYFLPGRYRAIIYIRPISDARTEGNEQVIVTILAEANYKLGASFQASLTIRDR